MNRARLHAEQLNSVRSLGEQMAADVRGWSVLAVLSDKRLLALAIVQLMHRTHAVAEHERACTICQLVRGGALLDCDDWQRLARRASKAALAAWYYADEPMPGWLALLSQGAQIGRGL